jgi:4-amino-4-deoxy-L-arabinose transferase
MNQTEKPPRTHKRLPLFLVALAAAFAFQGSRGLWGSTEGRYAECAREMLATGHWLVPHLDGRPHWSKPPLGYWAMMAGMAVLGANEWGARAANALAFVVLVLAVARVGALLWDRRTGRVAGLIAATSPFLVAGANVVSLDLLLALWVVLVMMAYAEARRASRPRLRRLWVVALWAFAGAGFLTKGPAVLVAAVVPLLAFHFWAVRRRWTRPRLFSPVGLLLFVAIGFGWYLWAVLSTPGLLTYLLGAEVVARTTGERFGRNPEWYKPFALYLPAFVFGPGLWAIYWFAPLRGGGAGRRFASFVAGLGRNDPAVFLLLWIALPLLVFSIVRSRMPLYVLPLLPPVALVLARFAVRRIETGGSVLGFRLALLAACVLAVAGKAAVARLPAREDARVVFHACQPFDRPGTTFILYALNPNYGLEFYLGGRLLHVSPRDPSEERLLPLLADLERSAPGGQCVLVVHRAQFLRAEALLDQAGRSFRLRPAGPEYRLLVLTPPASARCSGTAAPAGRRPASPLPASASWSPTEIRSGWSGESTASGRCA